MASFVASAMGFWVLVLEHVFKNSQKICEGVYFNRVADLISVVEVAASDRFRDVMGKEAMKTEYRAFDELLGIEVAWNQVKLVIRIGFRSGSDGGVTTYRDGLEYERRRSHNVDPLSLLHLHLNSSDFR
ncbi:hypothetical protein JHK82_015503 [Glycine max]|nr:hypothetical protein JHK85_015885 [Glycine max]KAG5046119.1 hypothetical protein JHK86_015525 [Glycine max]KAG5148622.1 hypothetical protein JHK82_015503 [Glycine max]